MRQGLGLAGKREDIISGKGNGLIMLLHGGPGTGKTLTAGNESAEFRSLESYSRLSREVSYDNSSPSVIQAAEPLHSVAETAEMPLYRVTCGDIGTSAEAVEKYLNNVLYLGKTWNCGKSGTKLFRI